MKRLLTFLFIWVSLVANAQIFENAQIQLSTNPAQYAFSGFNLRYAEQRGALRAGLDLGFRPSYCEGCEVNGGNGIAGEYRDQNFFNYTYNGLTLGSFFDYFISDGGAFVSIQPYYRLWWFNDKRLAYDNVEGYSFNGRRTESNQVVGLRLMTGAGIGLWSNPTSKGMIEISCGPGLMFRWTKFITHEGFIGQNRVQNYVERHHGLVHPVFHIRLDFTITLPQKEK